MRSIIILRGKIRADKERAKRSIVVAMNERWSVDDRYVSSNRRWEAWKKGGRTYSRRGGEKGLATLSRGIAFFDVAFSTLGVGIAKNSLAIKERKEKGSRKTDRGERLRKQSQSNAIEIAGNSSSRIRSLDKGESIEGVDPRLVESERKGERKRRASEPVRARQRLREGR